MYSKKYSCFFQKWMRKNIGKENVAINYRKRYKIDTFIGESSNKAGNILG